MNTVTGAAAVLPSQTVALIAACITASVAVLVAVGNAWWMWRRDRDTRAYERRRSSLLDVQDACLALRNSLHKYGQSLDANAHNLTDAAIVKVEAAPEDSHALVAAEGLLDVRVSRIDIPRVSEAVILWLNQARQRFLSTEDVSTSDERQAWDSMNDAVATALADSNLTRRTLKETLKWPWLRKTKQVDAAPADAPDSQPSP